MPDKDLLMADLSEYSKKAERIKMTGDHQNSSAFFALII